MTDLKYATLVVDGPPRSGEKLFPTGERMCASPLSVTLIHGPTEAVLVDAPYTRGQIERVQWWLEGFNVRLKAVFVTHGHGDHWLGAPSLLESFPGATLHATPGTLARMELEAVDARARVYDVDFPGLIPPSPLIGQAVPEGGLTVDGHQLQVIELGHTDTDDTSALWVPDIGLLVAGDSVYNGVHQMIREIGDGGLESWLAALQKLADLNPTHVVAGHKAPGASDDPTTIDETRQYLLYVKELLAQRPSPEEFYRSMLRKYPYRINPAPVWYSGVALLT